MLTRRDVGSAFGLRGGRVHGPCLRGGAAAWRGGSGLRVGRVRGESARQTSALARRATRMAIALTILQPSRCIAIHVTSRREATATLMSMSACHALVRMVVHARILLHTTREIQSVLGTTRARV